MVNNQTNEQTLHPQCLKMRVHSSILLLIEEAEACNSNSGENLLLLPSDIVFGASDRNSDGITKFQINGNLQDGCICTREEKACMSHVFMRNVNESPNQGDIEIKNEKKDSCHRFDFIASSAPERIVLQPSVGHIKEYGRRARARSEQQRQNRKGIQLIDGSSLIVEHAQKQERTKCSSSTNNIGKKRKLRQRHSQIQHSRPIKVARKTDKLFWTPDISQIPITSKSIQSTYVQLHGLPIGSTFETIRKFFTGLIPERILLLLNNRTYITDLDSSSYDDLSLYNLQNFVYTNKDVRVLVKFESVSAAGLAADRSGETISSKHVGYTFNYSNGQDRTIDHLQHDFSIGVTKMSKEMAVSLSKLSFDAIPGVPFRDCLSDVESKLNPKVREILWTSARIACQVTVDSEIKNANLLIEAAGREDNTTDETNLLTFAEYKNHSICYNRMLRIQEDLMASIQSEKSDNESSISMDPIIRLTANAYKVIDDKMNRIGSLLYQYRASRFK